VARRAHPHGHGGEARHRDVELAVAAGPGPPGLLDDVLASEARLDPHALKRGARRAPDDAAHGAGRAQLQHLQRDALVHVELELALLGAAGRRQRPPALLQAPEREVAVGVGAAGDGARLAGGVDLHVRHRPVGRDDDALDGMGARPGGQQEREGEEGAEVHRASAS
jgi:hypothetical protein